MHLTLSDKFQSSYKSEVIEYRFSWEGEKSIVQGQVDNIILDPNIISNNKSTSSIDQIKCLIKEILPDCNLTHMEEKLSSFLKINDTETLIQSMKDLIALSLLNERRIDNAVEVDFKAYLPKKAPILYKEWKKLDENKEKSALDCLEEVYGKYLSLGVLYQDDLGGKYGLDPALLKAIINACAKLECHYSSIIKPKSAKMEKLAIEIDYKKVLIAKNICDKRRR
ncbi:MAG: hypothetical protein GY828_03800 [Candidatus Gracilibacteria bacterium]|nr:hypothetical protein [Candidatus Gracilibacteria bacterium]